MENKYMNEIASQEKILKTRFLNLWESTCGLKSKKHSSEVWHVLVEHYTDSDRHYHTLNHLAHCIKQLDLSITYIDDPASLELAIFFHDIICQAGNPDNEQLSAHLFASLAKGSCTQNQIHRVMNMILATRHTSTQISNNDQRIICDIDLSSFALPWHEFIRDSHDIRTEAVEVPAPIFYPGKIKYLSKMLQRPVIYMTDFFYHRYEMLARENISKYIKQLNKRVEYV